MGAMFRPSIYGSRFQILWGPFSYLSVTNTDLFDQSVVQVAAAARKGADPAVQVEREARETVERH